MIKALRFCGLAAWFHGTPPTHYCQSTLRAFVCAVPDRP
jgi:hypothetical protein